MGILLRAALSPAQSARNMVRSMRHSHGLNCSCRSHAEHHVSPLHAVPLSSAGSVAAKPDYAFEMAASAIRFGPGATAEVGMDMKTLKAQRVCVVTDKNIAALGAATQTIQALTKSKINFTVYDEAQIEPTDSSVNKAIAFARTYQPDSFIAVGGGSVIDTAKLMNLFTCYGEADLLDFVNQPIGRGYSIDKKLLPLIAIPTTAGTGSETTGTAIFDLAAGRSKVGIANRALRPMLGICDPLNTRTMPRAVQISSGLDVLCHSLESWTAIPYDQRAPRPTTPADRPTYQGANPISDIFSLHALRETVKYLPRAARDAEDVEARDKMLLASTLAGVGFGNAGVHLCHGMSYPISSQNPGYRHAGYQVDKALIPHGVSVAVTAPSVFRFTAASSPERHLAAAEAFGVDISSVKRASSGEVLGEAIANFLSRLGDQPRGLKALGYGRGDVEALVEGTLPQRRVLKIAPNMPDTLDEERDVLSKIFEDSLVY